MSTQFDVFLAHLAHSSIRAFRTGSKIFGLSAAAVIVPTELETRLYVITILLHNLCYSLANACSFRLLTYSRLSFRTLALCQHDISRCSSGRSLTTTNQFQDYER